MAESLITYYNYVRDDPRTHFISKESQLDSIGRWPSLFKGNAVLNPSDESEEFMEKSCCSVIGASAEVTWLTFPSAKLENSVYFRPVREKEHIIRTEPWRGESSCIHRVFGITAEELLWHVQKVGRLYPDLKPKLGVLAGSVAHQALSALKEFREIGAQVLKPEAQKPYPWEQKLDAALAEAGRFITHSQDLQSE